VAFLPFISTTFNYISRMLSKHIKTVCILPRKLSSFLQPIKDDLELKVLSVCTIPYNCEKVYIRQDGCLIKTRVKEHHRHIHFYHPEKHAAAEHSINLGHCIQVYTTSILAKKSRHMNRIIREAKEIELHPSINREDGFSLSRS
jgi:hypothetical protein